MWDPIVSVPDHCVSLYFKVAGHLRHKGSTPCQPAGIVVKHS